MLYKNDINLNFESSIQINATVLPEDTSNKDIKWSSSDAKIASVTESGIVTAHKKGKVIITAETCDGSGVKAGCIVNVVQLAKSISISAVDYDNWYLDNFASVQLAVGFYPEDTDDKTVTWTSDHPDIVSVDENGLVTAHDKRGDVTITATTADGSGETAFYTFRVLENFYAVNNIAGLESQHPYEGNCSDIWQYERAGATYLEVTFDERTKVSAPCYIYIYDGEGNEVGKYTEDQLAGQTVHINGNKVKINIVSYGAYREWGFKVTDIKSDGIVYGDLNGDGEITATDVTMARRFYRGNLELTPEQQECLDLDLNGEITAADVTILRRYYRGALSEIPVK